MIGPWLMYWVTNLKVMSSRSTDKPLSCVLWPKEVMSTIHLIYLKSTDSYQSRVSTSIGCLKNKTKQNSVCFVNEAANSWWGFFQLVFLFIFI